MKTRDIKELLILLKDYIKTEKKFAGMCISIVYMWEEELINGMESDLLDNFIMSRKPDNVPGYWWTQGSKTPRVKWLNEQIAKF